MLKLCKLFFLLIAITAIATSCIDVKGVNDTPYFKDLPDSTSEAIRTAIYHPIKIQPGDNLSVTVNVLDPVASNALSSVQQYSQFQGANQSMGVINQPSNVSGGYVVSKNGTISLPLVGEVALNGLNLEEAKSKLTEAVGKYYKNPVVNVKLNNFYVNILGAVTRPGKYVMVSEKNTILDAIAQAGDLDLTGKRTNLILIRDSLGHSVMTRFSLGSKDLVTKDFFYLKQNDIVYVEPNKYAAKNANQDKSMLTYVSIGLSAISVLVVVINSATK